MEEFVNGITKSESTLPKNFETMEKQNHPFTAVVVDDSSDVVELFAELLEIRGIHVVGKGYDGKDAVLLYEKCRPDVTFLDIMMPVYDGFYALENIRRINQYAKIMLVTADMSKETADKLVDKLGGEESLMLIYKPFDFDILMQTLDQFMKPADVNSIPLQGSRI